MLQSYLQNLITFIQVLLFASHALGELVRRGQLTVNRIQEKKSVSCACHEATGGKHKEETSYPG